MSERYFKLSKYPYSSHQIIIRLVGGGRKVLDVGCSNGNLAKIFQENGCEVVGIEYDSSAAEKAKEFCQEVIQGDLDDDKIFRHKVLQKEKFDVIVCGDILEHLKDPAAVLEKLKKLLKPEGYFVISLPNVAHYTVRWQLLRGKWNYQETGILDKTHLRFFTYKSMLRLFSELNLEVENVFYSPWVPPLRRFWRRIKLVPYLEYFLTNFFPELFALQFISKVKIKKV